MVRRSLVALLLVAGVVGYVVWQRPAPPVQPPAPPKPVVLRYADGSKLWSSTDGGPRSEVVKRVLAELAANSMPFDSLVRDGAVVYTTIDAKAQTRAAAILGRLVAPRGGGLGGAVTAIDPASCGVVAYLSGFSHVPDLAAEPKEPGPGLVVAQDVVKTRMTPLEVSATFATFAAGGLQCEPHLVAEVTGADGARRYLAAGEAKPVLGKELADQVTARLQANPVCKGVACAPSSHPTHAWMAGYTPRLAVAVLVEQAGAAADDADLPGVIFQEFLAG
ncbi:hypothetical protein GCM10010178_43200 [Lentzea flava]|uniref:Beta-lactamase enzyme family protein n=1 Tax=Lentzea flava TaxID=103732 RepID=A0ABQ2UPJ2_9PSEU|nr:hypothetical protein [Lentzea flava]GGU46003.1 hypothetical protein GCM10010178_43200 [Lentzea flava]